ncbi:MAG: tripartite tricarboxylate transporter substrate binding protein [Deltaproteobacteria bacterium]|nr:tripartite tricarboxylate transporter substrate binding protein [Deltaproteobacteria bacterium]
MTMRWFTKCTGLAVLLGLFAGGWTSVSECAAAAAYPTKPIQIVVAFAPGGSSDQASRLLATYLSKKWGQPVSVVNKPGGGGVVGTAAVAQSAPDGYTVNNGMVNTLAFAPAAQSNNPYRWDSFTYLARLGVTPSVLTVNANSPYKTAKDLVEAIKKDPSKFKAGVSGLAGTGAFGIAQLLYSTGVEPSKVDMVSFNGGVLVVTNLAGGHVDFVAQQLPEVLELVKAGKLRALMHTNTERVQELPDVPTSKEAGFPAYSVMAASGYVGPLNMPEAIVSKWETAIADALKDKEFVASLDKMGLIPAYQNAKAYRAWTEEQFKNSQILAVKLGLKK